MTTKAKLTIVLKADNTIVAEAENPRLWGKILALLNKPEGAAEALEELEANEDDPNQGDVIKRGSGHRSSGDAVSRLAHKLGVDTASVQAALSPQTEPPYLHLDSHCWEAMKKGTPRRGAGAVPPIGAAATLLALWLKEAGIDVPATQTLAQGVLNTLNLRDPNASRGIANTKWLQRRPNGVVIINPAEVSTAQNIAASFCSKRWANS